MIPGIERLHSNAYGQGLIVMTVLTAMFTVPVFAAHEHETLSEATPVVIAQASEQGGSGAGAWQILKRPYSLPDLPMYSGAIYVGGLIYPNKPGGASIGMKYKISADSQTAADWYRQSFRNSKWTVSPPAGSQSGPTSVSAVNGKNSCVVSFSQGKDPKYPTMVYISYKLAN